MSSKDASKETKVKTPADLAVAAQKFHLDPANPEHKKNAKGERAKMLDLAKEVQPGSCVPTVDEPREKSTFGKNGKSYRIEYTFKDSTSLQSNGVKVAGKKAVIYLGDTSGPSFLTLTGCAIPAWFKRAGQSKAVEIELI